MAPFGRGDFGGVDYFGGPTDDSSSSDGGGNSSSDDGGSNGPDDHSEYSGGNDQDPGDYEYDPADSRYPLGRERKNLGRATSSNHLLCHALPRGHTLFAVVKLCHPYDYGVVVPIPGM